MTSTDTTIPQLEQTVALIKPSGIYRMEDIKRRLITAQLTIISIHTIKFTTALTHRYFHHRYKKKGYNSLVSSIANRIVICIILSRHNAVQRLNNVLRSTDIITRDTVIASPTHDIAHKHIDCILHHNKYRLVLCGPPASGKGTQCQLLCDAYNLIHISTGDLLRDVIANPIKANQQFNISQSLIDTIQATIKNGQLVSDTIVFQLLSARLLASDCITNGFVLDGFPRTDSQAILLGDSGIHITNCIVLNVSDQTITQRVTGRRLDPITNKTYHIQYNPPPDDVIANRCIQRSDDTADIIQQRLLTYHTQLNSITKHLINIHNVYDTPTSNNNNTSNNSVYDVFHKIIDGIDNNKLSPTSQVIRLKSSRTRERYQSAL